MEQLSSIEQSLAKLFKDLPHLPKEVRDWLADNAWWLVIIAVAIQAFGVLSLLTVLFFGSTLLSVFAGPIVGGALLVSGVVVIAVSAAAVIIEAMAIQPLKLKQKFGWSLMFLAQLVSFAGAVVGAVLSGNIGGILGPIIGAAISLYVLFELRSYFSVAKVSGKKV